MAESIMTIIKKSLYHLTGAAIGGVGGFIYWYLVGCNSGACLITSSPVLTVIWGAMTGALLFGIIGDKRRKEQS